MAKPHRLPSFLPFRALSNVRGRARYLFTIAGAALVFWLAFDKGTYSLESRGIVAIAAWWTILVATTLGMWPLARPPRAAIVVGGLVTALAVTTLASIAWAASDEAAFDEFNRVTLYLGVYVIAVFVGTHTNVGTWSDALAIGIAAVGVLALASRLFPDVLPAGDVAAFLPGADARLSYPLDYWNGLGILVALAFPLLLRSAVTARHAVVRGLAIGIVPALGATIFLTSSRGGVATVLVGTAVFLALTERRVAALAAAGVGILGSAAAIAVLLARDELVNDPAASPTVVAQGRTAAALIVLICAVAAVAYAFGSRLILARGMRVPRVAARAATALVIVGAVVGIAMADPVERFEAFKAPPTAIEDAESDFVRAHLVSGTGSGRWQLWAAAVDEFETRPLLGRGAGSYESWWAQHRTITMFVRDAHSLYLETLGELGIVGFALVASAFAVGIVSGSRRTRSTRGDRRVTAAALTACFVGYAVAAGIDWMWELTVVSVVGMACLGLITGPATTAAARLRSREAGVAVEARSRRRFALAAGALVGAWLVICAQAIPVLAQTKLSDSRAAAREGDGARAQDDAIAARSLQPWAASPYLQLALVAEQRRDLTQARIWIEEAIERDRENWRLWLVAARLETKDGAIADARRSLARAAELNPRSPLFENIS